MRRLLIVLCAGALIAPAAAAAKSENGVFTIEVSGISSGAWSGLSDQEGQAASGDLSDITSDGPIASC
jgi:hypothetical protein